MSYELRLRRLDKSKPSDIAALQRILDAAPRYSINISGSRPSQSAAEESLNAVPENFETKNKFTWTIEENGTPIGCIDLLRGFPNTETAMLGLLLLGESLQRKGYGKASFEALMRVVSGWPEIKRIRIGVVLTNSEVLPFWRSLGFKETGLKRPYENGSVVSENILLERSLA